MVPQKKMARNKRKTEFGEIDKPWSPDQSVKNGKINAH